MSSVVRPAGMVHAFEERAENRASKPPAQQEPASISAALRRALMWRLGLIFVVAALGLYEFIRIALTSQFDSTTMNKVTALESIVRIAPGDGNDQLPQPWVDFDELREAMPEFGRRIDPEIFQFWLIPSADNVSPGDLRVLSRSPTLDRPDGPGAPGQRGQRGIDMEIRIPRGEESLTDTLHMPEPDGRRARCTWVVFDVGGPNANDTPSQRVLLAVARASTRLDYSMRTVALGLVGVGLFGALIVRLSIHRTVERAIGPVGRLAAAMAAVDARRLPERLDVPPLPLELEPVRQRLDDLLHRIRAVLASRQGQDERPAEPTPAARETPEANPSLNS